MQALTAARFDDMLAHVTFIHGEGSRAGRDSRLYLPLVGSDTDMGPGGLATPNRAGVCGAAPQQIGRC